MTLGLLAALNLFLFCRLLWSDQGLFAYLDLKARHADIDYRVEELHKKSLELSQEIRLLKSDRPYIEKMIRQQMNFIKNDEILYVFPETAGEEFVESIANGVVGAGRHGD